VLTRGEATWSDDLLLVLERNNYREEAYFTYSYSPIKRSDGSIGGVFSAITETTERVLGERRLRTLRELAAQTAESKSVLARNYAYQVLLLDEWRRRSVEVVFLNRPLGQSPEDDLPCRYKASWPNTSGPRSWSGVDAARSMRPKAGRSTSCPVLRSGTAMYLFARVEVRRDLSQ
jgi:hypothetical protein